MINFSFIDLFAGIGGFRLALESVGGHCLGFSEIASDAIHTYCANFNESEESNFGDITKIKDLPFHDFMTAGVPCQSWSIAGKNLGFDDDRGQLWNDTLYLLNKVRPKAFLFENVKGLSDPRNQKALDYILSRIKQAGYYAQKYVLNAFDYGVPQTRVRIYIIGFREEKHLKRLQLPKPFPGEVRLNNVLDSEIDMVCEDGLETRPRWSLSCNEKGFNDYFLFNDLRNGATTIHSWDIIETTDREKHICYLLLRNRRKSEYGELDGNPLSIKHFKALDATIQREELETLVCKHILKHVDYLYEIEHEDETFEPNEQFILSLGKGNLLNVDNLKVNREVKKRKIDVHEVLSKLAQRKIIRCVETRYDFKNTKISTGLAGINRIFLPSSKIYPTLVASDTNDFVATEPIDAETIEDFRKEFMERIYRPKNFRKITQSEACRIQGFPDNFMLPPSRPRWMKLIGNSVAVPVIKILVNAVVGTGVFDVTSDKEIDVNNKPVARVKQISFINVMKEYPENIVENKPIIPQHEVSNVDLDKNVLISYVKADNMEQYLDQSAKIYYTGKRFPSTVALNKLYYFMPYIKRKGIRDLYLIKIARVGTRKEGQPNNDPNDFRLVFEIEFVKKLFNDYKPVELDIWHTFKDTTMKEIITK
jgi:DNA (cytosine-5)-methyltransferase 1